MERGAWVPELHPLLIHEPCHRNSTRVRRKQCVSCMYSCSLARPSRQSASSVIRPIAEYDFAQRPNRTSPLRFSQRPLTAGHINIQRLAPWFLFTSKPNYEPRACSVNPLGDKCEIAAWTPRIRPSSQPERLVNSIDCCCFQYY